MKIIKGWAVAGAFCFGVSSAQAETFNFTTISDPDATAHGTDSFDINNRGQIVGGFGDDVGPHGFLYTGGSFTTIDVPGSVGTVAQGINESGQIVGVYFVNIPNRGQVGYGFLDDAGNFTSLEVPGAFQNSATGINSSGQIIGHYATIDPITQSQQQFGFLYAGGVFTTIADGIQPNGINDAGVFTEIRVPGSIETDPMAINNAGDIAGFFDDGTVRHGFLLADGIYTTIDVPIALAFGEWSIPVGLNDRGQIVGDYIDHFTGSQGFLATPVVPIPPTLPLFASGLVGLGWLSTRRRKKAA